MKIKIVNTTKKTIISDNAKIAASIHDRLFGLLDPRNPRFIVFNTRFGLHTIFMNTPIDVVLLDDSNKVVKLKRGLLPNRLFFYHPKYSTVIEMPNGTIEKCRIAIDDKIFIA